MTPAFDIADSAKSAAGASSMDFLLPRRWNKEWHPLMEEQLEDLDSTRLRVRCWRPTQLARLTMPQRCSPSR